MFSSFVPHSVTIFGFGKAAVTGTPIHIPPIEIHDTEKSTDERGRRLRHLLKLNHVNFAILYHRLQFHNHTPHILGSAYLLNGPTDHLNGIYDSTTHSGHEPWTPSPSEIALHDWRSFLGKREYQRAFIDFFEDQLVEHGYDWKALVAHFLHEDSDSHPLINCLVSGLGHPLIHLGYAFELNSREVAIEALGLAATCYDDLHKYLDDESYSNRPTPYKTSNPFEVLARVNADTRLPPSPGLGSDDISDVFEKHEAILLEHWNAWTLTKTGATAAFEQSQRLAVALLFATAPSVPGGKGYGFDFFFVHLLTTSHAVRILLPELPNRWHLPLLRQWWLIVLAVYITQGRPVVDPKFVAGFDPGDKSWKWTEHEAVAGKWKYDAHFVKATRAIKEAGKVCGDGDGWFEKAGVKLATEFEGWGGFGMEEIERGGG